ncbi:hypothetical protein MKW92_038364 [Papaver armeniacum]|nr:hypothetical protein MKW92_038364 [Papaver armeniacum]
MENGEIENQDDDNHHHHIPVSHQTVVGGRRQYTPVVAHDRAVLEMTSLESGGGGGGGSSTPPPPSSGETSSPSRGNQDRPQRDSKLELFGFDSLVNILGLKSMTGEQLAAPSSPRDGEDVSITLGRPKPNDLKMGTMMGVFVPCLQNILGIIYYIRFSCHYCWFLFCGLCTFLTSISLSAIATNGAMKGGGPYYLIGFERLVQRLVLVLGCASSSNAVAGSMYVLGAVGNLLDAVPAAGIFKGSITSVNATSGATEHIQTPNLHDLQVYGIVVTIILCFIVFGGVKIINKVAPAFLVPVLLSIFCIFVGMFAAKKDYPSPGVTGLSAETFKDNWSSEYQRTNSAGVPDPEGSSYWNFNALVGLFFPAVTGIMAGSNRSASLKDTQRSIPVGTLSATLVTSALYLVSVLFFGALATREKLLKDRLLTATVAWPIPAVIYVGIILSTLGAALQSLTGAPRLLAAIANDDILPVLNYFKVADGGEPHLATLFTAFICMICVVMGNLDLITPTITMFFLLCYAGVNLSSLASLIYYYVSLKGKAGDWGDGFKSAYFNLPSEVFANNVHPKNWYPIPLIFCRPWGKLPENVPCHPKLADFANCMKKKGRGIGCKTACRQLSTYIEYKRCEGVAEIIVAPNMSDGFRGIVQTMGLGNLKPNIVVMRYPEIWRRENLFEIPATFVGIINDCIVANKAVVIVKGLDEWPNEYQKQYGTIDLYWIVRDGGLMLLLSQLLLTKESFKAAKYRFFELKADVKKFLYDLRMQAEVIVITMKSWEVQVEGGPPQQDDSLEAFTSAQRRIATYLGEMKERARNEGTPLMADGKRVIVNEQQIEKFLYTTLKLNSTILRYSRMAAVVLVSLPPPPLNHPPYFYMEYMDLLVENVPRLLMVRGYRRDVVTLFT